MNEISPAGMNSEWSFSRSPVATIIIPQFNHSDLTIQCIRSLMNSDVRDWTLIVVSDGCRPDHIRPLRKLQEDQPQISVLSQPHLGVTRAWNNGANAATTDFLVFLNNDVLCQGDWGERLLAPIVRGTTPLTGIVLRRELFRLPPSGEQRTLCLYEGWCLGTRRDLFVARGGFDERMRLYWSDTDLQMRFARDLGHWDWLRNGLVAGLPLLHRRHRTTHAPGVAQESRELWREDRHQFLSKWTPAMTDMSWLWRQDAEVAAGV